MLPNGRLCDALTLREKAQITNENPIMNVPQATIDGRPIQDWAEGLCSHDPGVRKEAALTLTQPAVPPSQSAPVLLGSLTDADSEVRCIVRDFFLHLASEICGLRHQEGERKEELAKAKTVLEAQMLTVLEHEKKLAFRSKEVEEMNRELEGLTYLVSHDLRSPLRAIQGYAIALLEDYGQAPRDQIREDAKRISDWAKRMDNLITGLLILGRAVRASPEPTMIQLRELVDQIRSELATQEAGRNVVWDIGDLPEVLADAGLLRTVVGNLLSNALKFTM